MGPFPFGFEEELALLFFFLLFFRKLIVPPLATFILSSSYTHIAMSLSKFHFLGCILLLTTKVSNSFGKEAKIRWIRNSSLRARSIGFSLDAKLLILSMCSLMPPFIEYLSVTSYFISWIAYVFEESMN